MNEWRFDPETLTIKASCNNGWERFLRENDAWFTSSEPHLSPEQIRNKTKEPLTDKKLGSGGLISKDTMNAIMASEPKCDISSGIATIFVGDKKMKYMLPEIKEVIFNETGSATIVRWADGDKTVVHCGEGETFDRYTGFMACVCKKMFGGTTTAKKLMNGLDKKYQAKLKAEKEAKEKEKRDAEAKAAKAKADKLRKKKNEEAVEELVNLFLMNTEAKQRAEEILRSEKETQET